MTVNRGGTPKRSFSEWIGRFPAVCYCRNRKNWLEFKTGTVTVCCPSCSICGFVTVVQAAADGRFVIDSSVKPGTFNGQVRTTEPPERFTLKLGSGTNNALGPAAKLAAMAVSETTPL